ncbi:MAG: TetR/AcrR family transcriptional regulator [Caldilineaceae bacterium]|nr:TetR/AcrR family transcriptional regulator [Caldilineaceae bacterium]
MARIVKEHDVRRSEILASAQQLFYQKGYEQTSIRNILEANDIAKGTFYHYFDSKQALLQELVARLTDQTLVLVEPLVADTEMNAQEKFTRFFLTIGQWKVERKELLLQVLTAYYLDENIVLRHAFIDSSLERIAPMLATIIEQGVAEGVFAAGYVNETAEILLRIGQHLSEEIAALLLNPPPDMAAVVQRQVEAHEQAIERLLAAPTGSLHIFDLDTTLRWFTD